MIRSACLARRNESIHRILDLGLQPYADSFIPKSLCDKPEPVFPLCCDLCGDCGHIQTSYITNPSDRYSLYDYSYTSSNSSFSINYWNNYAQHIKSKLHLNEEDFVVEIGSNDGLLCSIFQSRGNRVLGIDASEHMSDLASSKGVNTIVGLFGHHMKDQILNNGTPKVVIANNVFNHAENPVEFATVVHSILSDGGLFVFESPYWIKSIETKRFDQVYHEHVSYMTVSSVTAMMKLSGFNIVDIEFTYYHGGSIRVYAQKNRPPKDFTHLIQHEKDLGAHDVHTYYNMMNLFLKQRSHLIYEIYGIKKRGGSVICVGAAAKGNTFLNFHNLNNLLIDYVTDSSIEKQGKFTPMSRIPICSDNVFASYKNPYALILSWNISDKIKKILLTINKNIIFIGE